jgi:hypothetical protein
MLLPHPAASTAVVIAAANNTTSVRFIAFSFPERSLHADLAAHRGVSLATASFSAISTRARSVSDWGVS